MVRSRYEAEQDWFAVKAILLDIHDLYCLRLLVILERYDKAAMLRDGVLVPIERMDYHTALDNLQDFVLEDDVMYNLFPQIVDRAEPGLQLLNL